MIQRQVCQPCLATGVTSAHSSLRECGTSSYVGLLMMASDENASHNCQYAVEQKWKRYALTLHTHLSRYSVGQSIRAQTLHFGHLRPFDHLLFDIVRISSYFSRSSKLTNTLLGYSSLPKSLATTQQRPDHMSTLS